MQQCPQCGMLCDEGMAHCVRCGGELAAASVPPPADAQPASAPDPTMPGVESRKLFCIRCGNEIPLNAHVCGKCGAAAVKIQAAEDIVPVSQPYYQQQEEYDRQSSPPGKRRSVMIGVLCAAALLIVIGCVGVFSSMSVSTPAPAPETAGEEPIIYVHENENLKYKTAAMDAAETITNTFDLDQDGGYSDATLNGTQLLSDDGRYLLYLNSFRDRSYGRATGDLFLRDLSSHTADAINPDRGIKIASNATDDFYFSGDGNYVVFVNGKKELFAWDFEKSYRLDSDVSGVLDINAEKVLYYKGNELDQYTSYVTDRDVFLISLAENSPDKVKIDTNINDIRDWNDDFTKFIYTKTSRTASKGSVLFSVYAYDLFSDTRDMLISDVNDVIDANVEDGSLLYLIGREGGVTIGDILEDDMLEQDALIEEPDMSEFPLLDKYYNGSDGYGGYGSDSGDELDPGSYYSDYMDLLEEWEKYSKLQEEYEAKLQRDKLREVLHNELELYDDFSTGRYDLYYLRDGERKKLDSDIFRSAAYEESFIRGEIEKNYVVYLKATNRELEQVKFSDVYDKWYYSSFDIQDYIDEQTTKLPYIALLDGSTAQLSGTEPNAPAYLDDFVVADEQDGIYYLLGDEDTYKGEYAMFYMAFSGENGIGKPVLVDEDVECFSAYERYQGGYLYTSVPNKGKQDLYVAKNGAANRLGYDVASAVYVYSYDDTLVFFENYNSSRETGDFCIMRDGEKTVVSDDVYDFFYRSDDLIYLLRNYNYGKGDLYVYNGETVELVDYDVTDVLGAW